MKRQNFSDRSPGSLVQMRMPDAADGGAVHVDIWAFVPSLLPPDVPVTRHLLVAAERARGSLSEFIGRARLVQNPNLIMAPLSRREAVLSNRIEGTYTEVRAVLRSEAAGEGRAETDYDVQEVLNYLHALNQGQEGVADGWPLNLSLVRALHADLLRGVRGRNKHPGSFRSEPVYIGNRDEGPRMARFVPPPPEQVAPLIDNLFAFTNDEPTYGSLVDAAILHYQFESIHPFEDGNGRLGRLLIPLFLLSRGAIDRPVLYLSSYFEDHRDAYLSLLNGVSTMGNWSEWILFFLQAVEAQAEESRKRIGRILDLKARYDNLVRSSSKAAILAIDFIMEHVFVSVSEIAKHTGTTYPTARSSIDSLVKLGVLTPSGKLRGRQVWEATELLNETYEV